MQSRRSELRNPKAWRRKRAERANDFSQDGDNTRSNFQNDRVFALALRVRAKDGGILISLTAINRNPSCTEMQKTSRSKVRMEARFRCPQPPKQTPRPNPLAQWRNKFRFQFDEPSHGSVNNVPLCATRHPSRQSLTLLRAARDPSQRSLTLPHATRHP